MKEVYTKLLSHYQHDVFVDTAAFTTALQNEMSNNSEQPMDTGGDQQAGATGSASKPAESSDKNDDDMNVD